ncbi:MAG: YcaO-like family protein [Myxococcota bacterium]
MNHVFSTPPCTVASAQWRSTTAAEFLPVAEAHARLLGAVRPTDLTGLDRLGVPCWQATRPAAVDVPGNITVLNGKAWTSGEARIGALMEAIERHYGEQPDLEPHIARPSELRATGQAHVQLASVPLAHGVQDPGDVPLAWYPGHDAEGQPCWIPAHDVQCPYRRIEGAANPVAWRSTGLASGANETEATFYGLLEVIERDAWAVARLARRATPVDLESCTSPRLRALRERLEDLDIGLAVHRLPGLGGVTTYAAALRDLSRDDGIFPAFGLCAHPDAFLALEQAVLEATQSRLAFINGAREDFDRIAQELQRVRELGPQPKQIWLPSEGPAEPAPREAATPPDDLGDALDAIVARLAEDGFDRVLRVRVNPADDPVAVVRVIVPGMSEAMHDGFWLGRRIRVRGRAS